MGHKPLTGQNFNKVEVFDVLPGVCLGHLSLSKKALPGPDPPLQILMEVVPIEICLRVMSDHKDNQQQ